jgi:small subunit ribosomal protein S9
MADEEQKPTNEEAPEEQAPDQPSEDAPEEAVTEEQPPPEPAPPTEPAPPAEPAGEKAEPAAKKEDVVPGAELEPIQLEPERELDPEEKARREAEAEERVRREEEATSDVPDEAAARKPAALETGSRYTATGKRKSAVARVIIEPGNGKIEVNSRTLEEYFPRPSHQTTAMQPLVGAGYAETVDVRARVHGGGIAGQAGAVRHGIAKALTIAEPELRPELKKRGFLTRDARVKERRKAGLKKARKRPQFSKR